MNLMSVVAWCWDVVSLLLQGDLGDWRLQTSKLTRTLVGAFIVVASRRRAARPPACQPTRSNMPLPTTCETLVPLPRDSPPIRSPQAVHSFIASRLSGKELIEIGTRNGDGMNCFTHHAKHATAIEIAKEYCVSLRQRSKQIEADHPGKGYNVTCSDYRVGGVLDADVITWWEQHPLDNIPGLKHARKEQDAGRLRKGAEAILLFDPKWGLDVRGWNALCPLSTWSARIHFDEQKKCLADNGGKSPRGSATCNRAFGHFIVAGIPISNVPLLTSVTEDERLKCQKRHRAGYNAVTDPNAWQFYDTSMPLAEAQDLVELAGSTPGRRLRFFSSRRAADRATPVRK